MLCTDPSYDNRTIASTLKMQIRTVQRAQGDENKLSGYGYGLWCAEGYDTPQRCPEYDTDPSDGEVPVMLELWGTLGSYLWVK